MVRRLQPNGLKVLLVDATQLEVKQMRKYKSTVQMVRPGDCSARRGAAFCRYETGPAISPRRTFRDGFDRAIEIFHCRIGSLLGRMRRESRSFLLPYWTGAGGATARTPVRQRRFLPCSN